MPMPASMTMVRLVHQLVVALSCALLCAVDASVHDYTGERFAGLGNAFVLNGGSEGVYASAAADSFIRYVCMYVCLDRRQKDCCFARVDAVVAIVLVGVVGE